MSSAGHEQGELPVDIESTTENHESQVQEKNGYSDGYDQMLKDSNNEATNIEASNSTGHEPKLDISREQTPETADDMASVYSDSAPGSPGSDNEGNQRRRTMPSLDTDRAVVKRTRTEESAEKNDTPSLAVKETHKKRISGKAIEKQWIPFENESFKSFENLCAISMGSVLERFKNSRQRDTKEAETQRILTQHWLSGKLPKSFLARLKVTKLPPSKSLVVRMRGVQDNNFDPLSIDQVNLRKTVFETYLSAEMKQLQSLEAYQSSLQNTYNSDLEYLNDFKKTTSNIRGQISQERIRNARELHLENKNDDEILDIKMKPKLPSVDTSTFATTRFDPDLDNDLQPLLDDIHQELSKFDSRKREILDLCDQLDIIERQLYTRKTK
ncbi:hypothetical protein JCM33374_g777 [Metschnikowia sp. JCM 33374]|nr:hypothetical protein JCM33374_g777 [Metschnikowia sp. JCM 33374]